MDPINNMQDTNANTTTTTAIVDTTANVDGSTGAKVKKLNQHLNKNCSCIDELFDTTEDIVSMKAHVKLFDKVINFADIQECVRDQPFVKCHPKNNLLNLDERLVESSRDVINAIEKFPRTKESVLCDVICVKKFPNVNFFPVDVKIDANKGMNFIPPRMVIDLSKENIQPNSGVRINTGYIFKIENVAPVISINSSGKIIRGNANRQVDTIIIPTIRSKHKGIVQNVYARDPDDTGFVTINFTTLSEFDLSSPVQIIFNAFRSKKPLDAVTLSNKLDQSTQLFKMRDSRNGRFVKNTKVKFIAEDFEIECANKLLLQTYDSKTEQRQIFEKQKICIDNLNAIFTSRKREWCNPDLCTVAGMFSPKSNQFVIQPIVEQLERGPHNTHGISFVQSKILLFSRNIKDYDETIRMINGSFSDLDNYLTIRKKFKSVTDNLSNLRVGAKTCLDIHKANPQYDLRQLLKIYDFNRGIDVKHPKFNEFLTYTDEQFKSVDYEKNSFSSVLQKQMKHLCYFLLPHKFTPQELEILSLETQKTETTNGEVDANKSKDSDINGTTATDVNANRNLKRKLSLDTNQETNTAENNDKAIIDGCDHHDINIEPKKIKP